jgi:hypothetical protein
MATVQEKAVYIFVLWFFLTKSVIKTQRRYGTAPPSDNAVRRWLKQFQETGNVLQRKGVGRPNTSQEDVDWIHEESSRSPQKSSRRASLQLGIPQTTVWRVVHNRLHLHSQQSHITTEVSQSVTLSWCQAPIWGPIPDFCYYQTVRVCWCGAASLTRGRVCSLQLLLVLASAVILGSHSCRTHDHILLSQIRPSPTWGPGPRIYVPQEQGGPVMAPHTGSPSSSPFTTRRDIAEVFEAASMRAVRARVTLRLALYRQSVRLGAKPLEAIFLTNSPCYIAPARTAQKTSLPLLRVLSLPGKRRVHRAVP